MILFWVIYKKKLNSKRPWSILKREDKLCSPQSFENLAWLSLTNLKQKQWYSQIWWRWLCISTWYFITFGTSLFFLNGKADNETNLQTPRYIKWGKIDSGIINMDIVTSYRAYKNTRTLQGANFSFLKIKADYTKDGRFYSTGNKLWKTKFGAVCISLHSGVRKWSSHFGYVTSLGVTDKATVESVPIEIDDN